MSVGCGFRVFAVNVQVLPGRQHGCTASLSLALTFATFRAVSPRFGRREKGHGAKHYLRATPEYGVSMSYHMTLDPPSIKTDFRKHCCPTHVDFRKTGHKRRNQALETELYTSRGSTRLSVLASCKLSFSMCYWSSSEGEFHFEVLSQETSVSKLNRKSCEIHANYMQAMI